MNTGARRAVNTDNYSARFRLSSFLPDNLHSQKKDPESGLESRWGGGLTRCNEKTEGGGKKNPSTTMPVLFCLLPCQTLASANELGVQL